MFTQYDNNPGTVHCAYSVRIQDINYKVDISRTVVSQSLPNNTTTNQRTNKTTLDRYKKSYSSAHQIHPCSPLFHHRSAGAEYRFLNIFTNQLLSKAGTGWVCAGTRFGFIQEQCSRSKQEQCSSLYWVLGRFIERHFIDGFFIDGFFIDGFFIDGFFIDGFFIDGFFIESAFHTVVTNIKRNDCRLLHNGISISKKERRRKLFRFNQVTTVDKTFYSQIGHFKERHFKDGHFIDRTFLRKLI